MEASRVCCCLNEEGCLYCRRHDGGFRAREHPFPESLGNREIVLPPGVVCDRCNSGPLSDLDNYFLNHPVVSLMRTFHGIETKAGKRAVSNWSNAKISNPSEAKLCIETNSNRTIQETGPNKFNLNLKSSRRITLADAALNTRAVWKMALGLAYVDHGADMFDPRLDDTRKMILGQAPAHGYMLWSRKGMPSESVSLQYWWPPIVHEDGIEGAPVFLNIFGVELATDLLRRTPANPVPTEFAHLVDLHVF